MNHEIVYYLIGFVVGVIISKIIFRKKENPIGTLRIDSSDPDGPYLFLELSSEPDSIKNEKYITLKVDTKSYISRQ